MCLDCNFWERGFLSPVWDGMPTVVYSVVAYPIGSILIFPMNTLIYSEGWQQLNLRGKRPSLWLFILTQWLALWSSSNWNLAGYNSGSLSFPYVKGQIPGMALSTLAFFFFLGMQLHVWQSSSYLWSWDMGYKLCTGTSKRRHKGSASWSPCHHDTGLGNFWLFLIWEKWQPLCWNHILIIVIT